MFKKVLIANRGAIACRIIRSLKLLGVTSVAVYSEVDYQSLHVSAADVAIQLPGFNATDTYLNQQLLIDIAKQQACEAIHPGYGFLSENATFVELCEQNDLCFIGPRAAHLRSFGLKHSARALAQENNIPLLPGTGLLDDLATARSQAETISYPIMLKSTAGGGGIGMRLCKNAEELTANFDSVKNLGQNNFGNNGIFLEKFIERARHIEVQVFGDGKGGVISLGERDCSLQRRNQKVVEETPAPGISDDVREQMQNTAIRLCAAVNYQSAGTVEYIYDPESSKFYFLEVNTRLQVEHGITEAVTGIDLVEWMLRLAAGDMPDLTSLIPEPKGHSIQLRLYAENPALNFIPSSGLITEFKKPQINCRLDTWVESGVEVPPYYDPMLAKLIVKAETRTKALEKLITALDELVCYGIETNKEYMQQILNDEKFQEASHYTSYLNQISYQGLTFKVINPGTQTTVQDLPGRLGYWHVGIPPSGPMDSMSFQLANRLLGNDAGSAGLEISFSGPTLKFNCAANIVLGGPEIQASIVSDNGSSVPVTCWKKTRIEAGHTLVIGAIKSAGARCYLCIENGIVVPDYLGSKATFSLGQFGGHGGRALATGDVLHLSSAQEVVKLPLQLPVALIPHYSNNWKIKVIYGPHGAPEFFTDNDISMLFETHWEVHYNSNRTGVRLVGPKPEWARKDGGEAGLHPSNIHDNAYAVGSVDFTGDMPVILGPDGPSLGGFVCPVTVIKADLWKLGQLKTGDRIQFQPIDIDVANDLAEQQSNEIKSLQLSSERTQKNNKETKHHISSLGSTVIHHRPPEGDCPEVNYRMSGEDNILVEYGPMVLDLSLRFRVDSLMKWLEANRTEAVIDLTPGIRSLQVHFDTSRTDHRQMLAILRQAEIELPALENLKLSSRIVHLPLSWDDPSIRIAIDKYIQSVRKDAPWCPSNLEFIRRINGLEDIDQVKQIIFDARYLVLGLGDVYLGAPVATPLDPRHRLITTKYNPARTWTPENAVGIGGAYLCIYGMEGPGGYQLVGRTLQMWNRYRVTREFEPDKPWLLRFFDQIKYFPVSAEELAEIRRDFPLGRYQLKIEKEEFDFGNYQNFLKDNADSIAAFRQQQQTAFSQERSRWRESDSSGSMEAFEEATITSEQSLSETEVAQNTHIAGSIWKLMVKEGSKVATGDTIAVVESMKMEINLEATHEGTISKILCREGFPVKAGQVVAYIELGEQP